MTKCEMETMKRTRFPPQSIWTCTLLQYLPCPVSLHCDRCRPVYLFTFFRLTYLKISEQIFVLCCVPPQVYARCKIEGSSWRRLAVRDVPLWKLEYFVWKIFYLPISEFRNIENYSLPHSNQVCQLNNRSLGKVSQSRLDVLRNLPLLSTKALFLWWFFKMNKHVSMYNTIKSIS